MKRLKTIFRYPGGKSKIAENIVKDIVPFSPSVFVDVFVGGGSVAVEMLNQNNKTKLILNDLDKYMYSFWKIMCGSKEDVLNLVNIINDNGSPTVEKFNKLRELKNNNNSEIINAYLAIFFNRTAFSGILRSGPIGGYEQKGRYKINCRFNQTKIVDGVYNISKMLQENGSECYNKDFREIIKRYGDLEDHFLYLDPPYMKQGHQLYNVSMEEKDYIDMANLLKNTKCKWIVSHDRYEPFIDLFSSWARISDTNSVPYTINSIKGNRKKELLFSNFEFEFNKRLIGRPQISNGIYKITCVKCKNEFNTMPNNMEKYANKNGININKVRNMYLCRKCRKEE